MNLPQRVIDTAGHDYGRHCVRRRRPELEYHLLVHRLGLRRGRQRVSEVQLGISDDDVSDFGTHARLRCLRGLFQRRPLTSAVQPRLRVDASPIVRSYLKFDVSGVSGTITNATLRIWANSSQPEGYGVYLVPDSSWTEGGITYGNAAAPGATLVGSSGPITGGTWTSVDVTSVVAGNGIISIAIQTVGNRNTSFSSREGSNPPQLVDHRKWRQ